MNTHLARESDGLSNEEDVTVTGSYSRGAAARIVPMDHPAPDPKKLLAFWMEWEAGDATPGLLMKNLKNGGMREILEELAAADS